MESPIRDCEVRYAGVAVGRATQVKDWTAGGAFIGFAEPLPSGTAIELRGENITQAARVEEVVESADPNVAGMRVSFLAPAPGSSAGSASSAPPAAPEAAPPAEGGAPAPHQGGGKRKRRR